MAGKYVAFDIETAKIVPGDDFHWQPHRPLGIACIASLASGEAAPRIWLTRDAEGQPAGQMSAADLAAFVDFLVDAAGQGAAALSWNGLAFDFDILAEESQLLESCRKLALGHVDMMFQVVCEKGFPVSLQSAASGLGVPGKLAGVAGVDAPVLSAQGKHDKVMEYVAQDVRTTLAVAEEAERRRMFAWTTRKGTVSTMPLKRGWLSVEEALKLPLPDTSWMSSPPVREEYLWWLAE